MKKVSIFLALIITLTLCGCGKKGVSINEVSTDTVANPDSSDDLNEPNQEQASGDVENEKSAADISGPDSANETDSTDNKNETDALNNTNDATDKNDTANTNDTAGANDINVNTESDSAGSETPQENALSEYTVTTYDEVKVMYALNSVNVRKGPSTDYKKVGILAYSQEITVTGQADTQWYEIVYGEEKAYVSNKYLQDDKPAEDSILALQKELQSQNITDAQMEALLLAAADMQKAAKTKTTADAQAESRLNVPAGTQPDSQPEAAPAAQPEVQPPPVPEIQPVTEVKNAAGIILVGDSRFVQMQEAVGVNYCTWIAEGGKGYTWLEEKAIARIDGCVGNGSKILINLGVNDTRNLQKYLTLINAKAAEWTALGATVYYVSVNPVWENLYTTEEQVEYFNTQMQNGLNAYVHWIDSHSYLTSVGYKLVDGLHYSSETSQVIYAYLLSCI